MTDTQIRTTTVWTIDPSHSSVEFSVKLLMVATARGRFPEVSGTITRDSENIENSSVDIQINASSIETHDDKRDGHLRSADFFDVANHPALTFRSTTVEALGNDLRIAGDLTIRGVTRPIVLEAAFNGQGTNPYGQQVISYSATTVVNRSVFGLTWNTALESGGVLVGDEVTITIEVLATA
jgi:polyisoprenoid-binding protein YceI